MGWGETAERDSKQGVKAGARTANSERKAFGQISGDSKAADSFVLKRPIVLDMGEASREQGFRLNGCR